MKLPKLFQETSLFNAERTVEASIRLLSDSITSMVAGAETYTDPNGNTVVNTMGTLIRQTLGNVLIQATKNASTAAEGGAAIISSLINVATDGVTISADKVNIEGATLFTSGRLSTASLNNAYDAKGSATTVANSAANEEQYIYIQAVSGTNSMSETTSWITASGESTSSDTTGLTPVWTTKRPTYRSKYPVIFVAKQKKTVGGKVTCSTPVKDDTLTVIDGGHITTGTIDASRATITNINASNISSGTLDGSKATITNINASNITTGTLDASKATITNINASNINTGTLSTDRIGANSLAIGKLASAVQTSISNGDAANTALKSGIGGRNLVKNATAGRDRTAEFSKTSTTATSGYQDTFSTAVNRIEGINKYIVSFEAKSTVATTMYCFFYLPNTTTESLSSTGQHGTSNDGACQVSIGTSWARYWVAWWQNDRAATDKSLIVGRLANDGTAKTLTIRAVKMETGSVATDWSPNPTLVDNDITSAATTASNYITKIDNNGIKVHADNNTATDYTQIDANGMEVFKSSTSIAKFGEVTRIGKASKSFTEIGVDSNSNNGYIDFYNSSIRMAHIGYESGTNRDGGQSLAPYYTFGTRDSSGSIGNYSFAEGESTIASGSSSHAEGYKTQSTGWGTHAEGFKTQATGWCSHAEGYQTQAKDESAHAEGTSTQATKEYSHAEGYYSVASNDAAHAEGSHSTASGRFSHAEGSSTASGHYSHSEGLSTEASGAYSHASGYYTIADIQNMTAVGAYNNPVLNALFVVGNGSNNNNRKNAFLVKSTMGGTASVYVRGTNTTDGESVSSDERVKTLIEDIPTDKALEFIRSVTPKMYYKEDANPEGELGFYAQEVEKTIFGKQLVTKDNSGMYDLPDFRVMSYEGFIAPMVAVLQHLIKENELLKDQNDKLENRIKALEYAIG